MYSKAKAYHPLANDTGGTASDRHNEAIRIIKMLNDAGIIGCMTSKEEAFVGGLEDDYFISPKQLFWLRGIKDKYL